MDSQYECFNDAECDTPLLNVKMLMERNPMKVNVLLFNSSIAMTACSVDYELTGARPDKSIDVTECPFSVVDGTNLLSYDCNPVFTNTNETWGGDVGSVGFYATDVMDIHLLIHLILNRSIGNFDLRHFI